MENQTSEIREIRLGLYSLLDRLEKLESRIGTQKSARPLSSPIPRIEIESPKSKSGPGMGSLLGLVGIVCFVLAASLVVKLAIESGWLTLERQWMLSVLFGVALYASTQLVRFQDRDYSQDLLGGGVTALYFSAFSSYLYFGIGSLQTSALMAALVSGLCLWTFHKNRHDFFVITAACGSYLTPIILGRADFDFQFTSFLFILWSSIYAWMGALLKSRTLTLTSSYLGLGVFALLYVTSKEELPTIAVVQFVQFLILLSGVVFHSLKSRKPLSSQEAWAYFPVLCFFYATEYFFLDRLFPNIAPWASLGFAGILLFFYIAAKKRIAETFPSWQVVLAFISLVVFHSGYLVLFPDNLKPALFPALLIGAAFFASRKTPLGKSVPVLLVAGAILFIEYFRMLREICFETTWNFLGFGFLGAFALIFYDRKVLSVSRLPASYFLLGAAHVLAAASLYRLTENNGTLAVSASWAIYSLGILGFGFYRRDASLAYSSVIVLLFATLKALLYDAAHAAAPMRIFCLILTGAVLYFSGFLFRKIAKF